jgi:hypothetical protein
MLDWTLQSRGLGEADAARLCSRVCSALAPALQARRRLAVAPAASPGRIVADVLEFLWPGQGRAPDFALPSRPAPRDAPPPAELAAVLAPYAELTRGRRPAEIVWPLDLFTRVDGRSWREPFELAGPARALIYGPYMHLPAGAWTARVEFEIDGALSGVEASTDVRLHEVVAEKSFVMPAKGVFAYDLDFEARDPHQPVEVRLFLRKAAIEGVFLPRSVRLRPLSSARR